MAYSFVPTNIMVNANPITFIDSGGTSRTSSAIFSDTNIENIAEAIGGKLSAVDFNLNGYKVCTSLTTPTQGYVCGEDKTVKALKWDNMPNLRIMFYSATSGTSGTAGAILAIYKLDTESVVFYAGIAHSSPAFNYINVYNINADCCVFKTNGNGSMCGAVLYKDYLIVAGEGPTGNGGSSNGMNVMKADGSYATIVCPYRILANEQIIISLEPIFLNENASESFEGVYLIWRAPNAITQVFSKDGVSYLQLGCDVGSGRGRNMLAISSEILGT